MAAPAYAGSQDSNITTPAGTAFFVDDGGTNFRIDGTADFNQLRWMALEAVRNLVDGPHIRCDVLAFDAVASCRSAF